MQRRLVSACLFMLGCASPPEQHVPAPVERARVVESERAARVGDIDISRADVERLMRATGLPARDALTRLENEILLAGEAERRGLGSSARARVVEEQLAVQRLLAAEVEAQVTRAVIPMTDVQAAYARSRARFDHPELRHTVHVLAKLSRNATSTQIEQARAFIARVIEEMRTSDPVQVKDRYASAAPSYPFEVRAEEVPPFSRTDEIAGPYRDATFALRAPAVVPTPIRTEFGFHAIALLQIVPEEHRSVEEVADLIRDELVTPLRERRVRELLSSIQARTPPMRDENAISAALARDLVEADSP